MAGKFQQGRVGHTVELAELVQVRRRRLADLPRLELTEVGIRNAGLRLDGAEREPLAAPGRREIRAEVVASVFSMTAKYTKHAKSVKQEISRNYQHRRLGPRARNHDKYLSMNLYGKYRYYLVPTTGESVEFAKAHALYTPRSFPRTGEHQRRGAQCWLLRLITGTDKVERLARHVTKPTSILVDHIQSIGDFGQHRDGAIPWNFAASFCYSAVELCELLARDLHGVLYFPGEGICHAARLSSLSAVA